MLLTTLSNSTLEEFTTNPLAAPPNLITECSSPDMVFLELLTIGSLRTLGEPLGVFKDTSGCLATEATTAVSPLLPLIL